MSVDRTPLRLISANPAARPEPLVGAVEAAVRLAGSDRGALVRRKHADAAPVVISFNLSPEEEAACRSLARRAWQQPARNGTLASRLGGSTLLAQPVDAEEGDATLIVAVRAGSGHHDAERLRALRDIAQLLSGAVGGALLADWATDRAVQERRRADRVLALNRALQALADTEDVVAAGEQMLAGLEPQFPGVDAFYLWLLEPDGQRLRMVASRGAVDPKRDAFVLPLHAGYGVDKAIESGEMQLLEFGQGAARTAPARQAKRLGFVCILHVPLRSRKAVTGMLTLAARSKREFASEERVFLESLGAQLGSQLDAIRELENAETERKRLQTLIDTLPAGVVVFDASGRVVLFNRAIEEIWGHTPLDTAIGRDAEAFGLLTADGRSLPPGDSPLARAANGRAEHAQELIVRQAGTNREIPVLVSGVPIRDGQGRLTGVITVYQDITQLREVDRLKDDFVNSVSHELRTPTTTVRGGALTLLKRGDQLEPEMRNQLLRDMADEAERLYHLVEDLLSLTRAQAGIQLQMEPLIPHRFVNKVLLDVGGRVGNHALTVDVAQDLPLIEADPARLEQVLRNLLENAVQFSPRGKRIEIAARLQGDEVLFSVLDRGSGIPAVDMNRVFEPFYRTADAVRTGAQGAGLGLAVARRLIEIMGGRIWAKARPGGGTAFHFTLPALKGEVE